MSNQETAVLTRAEVVRLADEAVTAVAKLRDVLADERAVPPPALLARALLLLQATRAKAERMADDTYNARFIYGPRGGRVP